MSEADLYRLWWTDISHTAGTGTVRYPLAQPPINADLAKLHVLPLAAWTADGTNYYTIALDLYDYDGTFLRTLPLSEKDPLLLLSTRSLAIGRGLVFPLIGWIGEKVQKGQLVYVRVDETGTPASNLEARIQVDVLVGRVG